MTLSSHQGGRTFRNNLAMFERGVLVGEASERNMQMLTMQISTILVVSKAKSFRCMSTRHFDTVNFRVVGQGSWDSRHPANKILMTFKINVLKNYHNNNSTSSFRFKKQEQCPQATADLPLRQREACQEHHVKISTTGSIKHRNHQHQLESSNAAKGHVQSSVNIKHAKGFLALLACCRGLGLSKLQRQRGM